MVRGMRAGEAPGFSRLTKYSVLLLVPDYAAETFGHDTFYTLVHAESPRAAIAAAQAETSATYTARPEDFHPLLVLLGHHAPEN